MSDRDIFLIEVSRRGRDGVGTPGDYATIRSDVASLNNRANITQLTDIPDVTGTPSDGDILIYNSSSDEWEMQPPAPAISVADTDSVDMTLTGTEVKADVRFAGTGSANTAARSDRSNRPIIRVRDTFAPGGYMSSGTRSLTSVSLTLLDGVTYFVEAKLQMQVRGADEGAAYYQKSINIAGNTLTSPGGAGGFWTVQGVPGSQPWEHSRTIAGTGAAITVSASIAYYSGSGLYTDYGVLIVNAWPDR